MKIIRTPSLFLVALAIGLAGNVIGVEPAIATTTDTHSISSLLPGAVFYDSALFSNVVRDAAPFDQEGDMTPDSAVQIIFPVDTYAAGFDIVSSSYATDANISIAFIDASGKMIGFQRGTLRANTPWFFGAIYTQAFRSIIVQSDISGRLADLQYSAKPCMQY